MKIAILGAGALGCYYGAQLVQSGQDVTFIMRSTYDKCKKNGLHIESPDGNIDIDSPQLSPSSEACGPVDLVILCWKSTSNHLLAEQLPHLLKEDTKVLTLQNGMGNAESIAEIVPAERIYIGLCFICAMMPEAGRIIHSTNKAIQVAPYLPSDESMRFSEEIAEMFKHATIPTKTFRHQEHILWSKLCWNIPFNGLCVAHGGITIGELFKLPGQVERARSIMQEVFLCAAKRGYILPEDLIDKQMESTAKMESYIPSSALDYIKGRPVEYTAIWGNPLKRAHESACEVPLWEELAVQIRERLNIS